MKSLEVLKSHKLHGHGSLLFIERGVLSFNGLNQSQDCPCAVSTHHPSVYLFAKWTPPTMCTASEWGLNSALCSNFNNFPCNSLLLLPPKHFFQTLLLIKNDAAALFSSSSNYPCPLPLTAVSLWLQAVCSLIKNLVLAWEPVLPAIPQGQGYLALLSLVIFPHGHHFCSCWIPEGGMTFPLWSEKQSHPPTVIHHLLKTHVFKHFFISTESFFFLLIAQKKKKLLSHELVLNSLLYAIFYGITFKLDSIVRVHWSWFSLSL